MAKFVCPQCRAEYHTAEFIPKGVIAICPRCAAASQYDGQTPDGKNLYHLLSITELLRLPTMDRALLAVFQHAVALRN